MILLLVAACGSAPPPASHPSNATKTERDAPATDLADPFARILAGAPLDHVCFAANADRTRVACATGTWDRQSGARFAIEVVGARSTRWDYSTFDGPGYGDGAAPVPIDHDQLARAKHQLEADGFTTHLAFTPLDKTANVGTTTFERAQTVLVQCPDHHEVPATPAIHEADTIEVAALASSILLTIESHQCDDTACNGARLALTLDPQALCQGH